MYNFEEPFIIRTLGLTKSRGGENKIPPSLEISIYTDPRFVVSPLVVVHVGSLKPILFGF